MRNSIIDDFMSNVHNYKLTGLSRLCKSFLEVDEMGLHNVIADFYGLIARDIAANISQIYNKDMCGIWGFLWYWRTMEVIWSSLCVILLEINM